MKKQKSVVKYNEHQSLVFQQECIRYRLPTAFAQEYFIFLTTLYGRKFETGDARIQDFSMMTMADICDEIKLRTNMLQADNQMKIQLYKDKKKKDQDKAIQELLQIQ